MKHFHWNSGLFVGADLLYRIPRNKRSSAAVPKKMRLLTYKHYDRLLRPACYDRLAQWSYLGVPLQCEEKLSLLLPKCCDEDHIKV